MTDGDNKEIPQGPQKKTLKDIFGGPPVESKITEPDPNYDPDADLKAKQRTPEKAQEAMFRETAKKLAAEEAEIVELAYDAAPKVHDIVVSGGTSFFCDADREKQEVGISSFVENVKDPNNTLRKMVSIGIRKSYNPVSRHIEKLNSDIDLRIEMHTDRSTQEEYRKLLDKDSKVVNVTRTYYFFDGGGELREDNSSSCKFICCPEQDNKRNEK